MSNQDDAQEALFKAIKATTDLVAASTGSLMPRATALQSLALAYRYTAGGAQPGSITVEK